MVEIQSTKEIQLEIDIPLSDSCEKITHESSRVDSCANLQQKYREQRLLSFLTAKNTQQRKYGSGWLSVSKPGGTARTDNKYLVYYYRVHWRKRPIAIHIGRTTDDKALVIARRVREAIDTGVPPHKIEALIKFGKR